MKKYIYILIFVIIAFNAHSHTNHYKGTVKIELDVIRNDKIIGYSNYFFVHDGKKMTVKNYTKFKVELFGVKIFSILSETTEIYNDEKLIYFKSNTFQNDKEKYVYLNYNKSSKKFIINGSSYKGEASEDCIIGNWWNHRIFKANKQISPLSGSIKEQVVTFIGKEKIDLYGKIYDADHFTLKSKDMNIPKDKRLDFDIWFDQENLRILKVTYSRMGNWEYRLKSFE